MTSSNGDTESTQAQPAPQPWDLTGWVPDKPSICDYGYVIKGNAIGCTREELLRAATWRGVGQIKLAWTPDTSQPVLPEKIPLLLESFRKVAIKSAWMSVGWGSALAGFGIVLAVVLEDWRYFYLNPLSVIGILGVVEGTWQLWRTRHYDQEDAAADASSLRFDAWVKNKNISGFTLMLCVWIVLVGAAQVLSGLEDSVQRAGLVKPAVWQGQWWRLLTACLMHGSFMHFWMNFLVLIHFSKIIENIVHRAYVPLLFLISGAVGSIFSVLLYPHTPSIGASGGLMGLCGFITTAAYFDRAKFPPKYLRQSIEGIAFVGIFGLAGFAFIDNAAHLGGLCAGLALGWLFRPRSEDVWVQKLIQRVSALSVLALTILGGFAVLAITKIMGYW
jgi:membrane associated rhomboid family serine protease